MNNYIIGVMGKKGSGKTELVKRNMPHIKRCIVLDPLAEYDGTIVYTWTELVDFLEQFKELEFKLVYRPSDFEDVDMFFKVANNVNNYTLIVEETELFCNQYIINPEFKRMIAFGRHGKRNIIWISRQPFEIHRDLTRQSDILITFRQTEPGDLKYLANYKFNKNIEELGQYEYAYFTDGKQKMPIGEKNDS